MIETLSTWFDIQAERTRAFPEKLFDNPLRTMLLDGVQRRNASLDALFYNVSAITEAEQATLAFWLAREGALLLVPPTGEGPLSLFLDPGRFLDAGGGDAAALAVAGVGSSALGSAAFARDVADGLGAPVAAVVSGYGLSDVVTEALGGAFWFGGLNSIRHAFEGLDRATRAITRSELETSVDAAAHAFSRDTATLIRLFEDDRFRTPLLVGHSKGNLVVSEALYALHHAGRLGTMLARGTRIVTVSARVAMPPEFAGRVVDVMGSLDSFGGLNSRQDIPTDLSIAGKWHSTNPEFPFDMGIDVPVAIRDALDLFDTGRPV